MTAEDVAGTVAAAEAAGSAAAPVPAVNSSFSSLQPNLQLAWDSTSLGAFKTCPRFYQLSVVEGWAPKETSVHLEFGIFFHEGLEFYDRFRGDGATHAEALRAAVHRLLGRTWDFQLKRPWLSGHPQKHRLSLLRSIVWYLDTFGENDSFETLTLPNGQPAVELSFSFGLGFESEAGEEFLLCGHIDRLVRFNDEAWVTDRKTTTGQLDDRYFGQFHPDNQVSTYDLAGQVMLGVPIRGLIIDGVQIGSGFARFQRRLVPRTAGEREEWLADLRSWLRSAEACAAEGRWPMNDKSCTGKYGDCQFKQICSKPPSARQQWLEAGFVKRSWDPLKVRLGGEAER